MEAGKILVTAAGAQVYERRLDFRRGGIYVAAEFILREKYELMGPRAPRQWRLRCSPYIETF